MTTRTIRILLIRGSEGEFLATRKLLEGSRGAAFLLDWVADYKAGLEAVRRNSHDVYLVDSAVDPGGAIALIRGSARIGCSAPIILFTSPNTTGLELVAAQAGASDCLVRREINGALLRRVILHGIERSNFRAQLLDRDVALAHLAAIVESSDDAIVGKTLDGIITSWNRGAEQLYGYSAEEAIGRPVTMIIPLDRMREQELTLARITKGERILPFDTVRLHKDGTPVAVSISISPIRDGDGRIIGASKTAQDITHRKRAQKRQDTQYEVTRILAKRQTLEDAAPSILRAVCRGLAWDVGQLWAADASGRVLRKVGQWRADEIEPGSSVLDAYTTFPSGVGLPGRVWEGGKPEWLWDLETLPPDEFPRMGMVRDEGLRAAFAFPIMTAGKATGVMEFFTREDRQPDPDLINAVTALGRQIGQFIDQSRTEQALAKSEARFRKLIEGSSDGIAVIVDGVIREASQRFAEIFGMTVEEVIGKQAAHFAADDVRGIAEQRIAGDVEGTYEIAGKRKDGSKVLLEINARTHDFGGHRERVASVRDVTEKRQLEIQLRQAQKMEAVGRLAGGIAHDFNNLLTVIITYVGLLLEGVCETDPRREDIDEIGRAAKAAADLTRQLLAFSRQQVLEPKVLVIEEIVASSQKLLTRLLGEDVQLVTTLAGGTTVKIDPGQLEQIIMNLAVNARDAMPTGGKITIETAIVDLSDAYAKAHWPAVPGRFAMLTVSDTGSGMDAETQSRIFEPFFTTKELGSGTGLGLATVYGIVKQSGGFIWVYSEPGDGATFKIYLPLVSESPSKMDPAELPQIPRGTETVLLLEDSPEVRVAVRESLKRYGYNVIEAASGHVAIDIATKHRGPIELLLTDVVMPEMSGRAAAEQLAEIRSEMKVLFMSGYTADAVVRHGVLSHGVAYLQKPFSPDALARRVREVLDIEA